MGGSFGLSRHDGTGVVRGLLGVLVVLAAMALGCTSGNGARPSTAQTRSPSTATSLARQPSTTVSAPNHTDIPSRPGCLASQYGLEEPVSVGATAMVGITTKIVGF